MPFCIRGAYSALFKGIGQENMFEYLEDSEGKKNTLKKVRIELGLTITALSKLANVSTKVISQTERGLTNPTMVTKSKIINGLNAALPSGKEPYEYRNIFPADEI